MSLIEGSFAVASLIVIALPGLVYAAIRRWARGELPHDRDFGRSVAAGVIFSISLTAVYMLVWSESLFSGLAAGTDADTLAVENVRRIAVVVLGLYVLVPAIISVGLNARHIAWMRPSVAWARWMWIPRSKHGYADTPTAWDHAAQLNQPAWVKIRRDDYWVGGYIRDGSFLTTYPEPRSIYVDQQYSMSPDGDWLTAIPGSSFYLTLADNDLVIWNRPGAVNVADGGDGFAKTSDA